MQELFLKSLFYLVIIVWFFSALPFLLLTCIPRKKDSPEKKQSRRKRLKLTLISAALTIISIIFYLCMNAYLHPPKETVFNMCNKNIEHMNATEKKQCVWVIPKKYNINIRSWYDESKMDGSFEVNVPWSDIDPEFAKNFEYEHADVGFLFSPEDSSYKNYINYINYNNNKNNNKNNPVLLERTDEDGFLWRTSNGSHREFVDVRFKAFDNTLVYLDDARSSTIIELKRPLYPTGTMRWMIDLYDGEKTQEQHEAYIKKNIKQIDQKLMQFISQWH